ncbi:MAG: DNA replication/repair protein RecF [Lachnospiraceae bacterium]|nr:DNA replication/repair protein RecF [Lachnospiraceae bacterium]
MIVKKIELLNYRNYEYLNIDFNSGINILYGDNAQGKTNILEALYMSGTSKSHKNAKDKETIRFGQEEAHIKTIVIKNSIEYKIDIHLKAHKLKGIAINGVPIKKATELFGVLNIIFFSPEDLNIIKEGPSERRRFIDMELCQLDKVYLHNLTSYNKALTQRNKLLKDIIDKPSLKDTLDSWDEQLIRYGTEIINRRKKFIDDLNEVIFLIHKKLSGNKEELTITYEPDVTVNNYKSALADARKKDERFLTTSVGPHRDDMAFLIKNVDLRKYGSQGQQRTAALSLKLSEIELVKSIIKDEPVLLLDDVLSELDKNRQNQLLGSLDKTQTIITCTGLDEFIKERIAIDKVFKVIDGKVYEGN